MTTFGTFDIDSVPAPSDFELQAADLRNRLRADRERIARQKATLRRIAQRILARNSPEAGNLRAGDGDGAMGGGTPT